MLVFGSHEQIRAQAELETIFEGERTDSCAFKVGSIVRYVLKVPRAFCANGARLRLLCDADQSESVTDANFVDDCEDFAYDVFSVELDTEHIGEGLYYLTFEVETVYGRLYPSTDMRFFENITSRFQLMVFEREFSTPRPLYGGMMYQIFPDRFKRKGSFLPTRGKLCEDMKNGKLQYAKVPGGEVANDSFYGGDLMGIADELDYIKSLGVNIIYLCPIFEAASNHRYDTGDYMKVDRLLGGEDGLKLLICEVKKRGMKLILDGVFNHTGADSLYFNRLGEYKEVGAYQSKDSKYYGWYTFYDYPDEYKCWWGVKILPAVKSDNADYIDFICGENGVLKHYLRMGIDGWRLDVADELSDVFLDSLRASVKSEYPEAFILGEVWEDASNKIAYDKRRRYLRGRQLDSVMNYPLREGIIDFILTRDKSRLESTAKTIYSHYPKESAALLMNLLGTHDTERILSVLADVGISDMTNDELSTYKLPKEKYYAASSRLKTAWALLTAFPGIPCIYYGDEIGSEGGRDPFCRMPFDHENADRELLCFYRRIGELHSSERAFAEGDLEFFDTADKGQLMLCRRMGNEAVYVMANLTDRYWDVELSGEYLIDTDNNGRPIPPMSVEYLKMYGDNVQNHSAEFVHSYKV